MNVSSKVPARFHGRTLLDYLTARFSYLSEADWRQLLTDGRITCAGIASPATLLVATGDIICCALPDFDAPAVNYDYSVVFQDDWLLAVNKPAGLRVHSGGKFVKANLMYHLRHVHQPAYPQASPAHRLDADTSGLVLLAWDKEVLTHLARQFAEGRIEKRYLAVVAGRPNPAEGSITLPIGPVRNARVPRFGVDSTDGKAAVTHYRTLRNLSAGYSLLELTPHSGRTHQLRVHLAAIGHPLAGDALYSMNDADYLAFRRNPPRQEGLQRQALHHHQLRFTHPLLRTACTITAPLAADIEQFIQSLCQ